MQEESKFLYKSHLIINIPLVQTSLDDENEVNWNIPYIPQQNFMEMEFGNNQNNFDDFYG